MSFQGAKGSGEEPPLNFELQLLRNKDRMTQARAQGDAHQYWVYFDTIMGDMVSFMSPAVRKKLEGKHDELQKKIEKVREDKTLNDAQRDKDITKLRVAFADDNKYYISKSLSRSGIVKVKDEGVVDLSKEDIDAYAVALRSHAALPESQDTPAKEE